MEDTLKSFVAFCLAHPKLRFWQALCEWSGAGAIWWVGRDPMRRGVTTKCDTFYWESRNR